MPARFDLATPAQIRFGAGRIAEAPEALAGLGVSRVLVVTGATASRADGLRAAMGRAGLASVPFPVAGEPTLDVVRRGVAAVAEERCDGVMGYGGGSALDAAKAIAALAPTGADPLDHLEVIGQGRPVRGPGLPCVAAPTTAGTGSEVTRNAVLSDGAVKASLRGPELLPRVALVDPDLLVGLSPATVAASGSDALAQLIEPFLSARANPVTDALAREGIRRSARSLRRAWQDGLDDDDVRDDLALASLFGGLCLANAGLGAAHGFAAAAGARFRAPHGAVCAALLASCVAVNLAALRERAPHHPAVPRIAEVAALLTGRPTARADEAAPWLADLTRAMEVPGLSAHGVTNDDIPELVRQAQQASSMRANPIELTEAELTAIATGSM